MIEFRTLGRSGVKISPICVGTFNFGGPTPAAEAKKIISAAVHGGINFFDTSNNYFGGESERVLGEAIAELGCRSDVVIASKCHFPTRDGLGPNWKGNSRLNILRSCDESLRRLRTDYIDLYQLHRPDFDVPVDETLGALTDLIRAGKVRYVGTSTHPAWKVMEMVMASEMKGLARVVAEQPPYNLLDRRIENELVPLCRAYGIGIIPYASIAQGVLAGRYAHATNVPADSRVATLGAWFAERVDEKGIAIGVRLQRLAEQHELLAVQLALLWVKDQPGISAPIFGPRTLQHLIDVLPVLELSLSADLRHACDELVPPGSSVTNFHNACSWMQQKLL